MTQPPPAPKAPLGPSRSLPAPAPRPRPRSPAPPRLRGASSLTALWLALWLALGSAHALPSAASTLRFATQPPDRPLALYRAPAPYQQSGKRPLNSVIITSKPFSITQQLATTPASTEGGATEEARASSSAPSAAGSAHAWRRVSSPTTQRPQVTLSLPQYSIDCAEGLSCSETIAVDAATQPPTFKPYPQDVLDKFLRDFAHAQRLPDDQHAKPTEESVERATNRLANLYLEHEAAGERGDAGSAEGAEEIEGEGERAEEEREGGESQGKSRWHLLSAQHHHHPYDDRDGWVSLEPVPWSTSKVAKWHATRTKRPDHHKPPNRWDTRPPLDWDKPSRPSWVRPSYEEDYEPPSRPSLSPWPSRPAHSPSHSAAPDHYPHRPWDAPAHDYEFQKPSHWPGGATSAHDIITDNRPNRWPDGGGGGGGGGGNGGYRPWEHKKPHYDYSHSGGGGGVRPSGGGGYDPHRHPPSHPEESEGQWVLVSSTKGFAVPQRHRIFQRALAISAKPLTARRTVRLTVLPALNGTANTTISHGGLLEVESTFQSVEEEQQQQELQHHLQQRPPPHPHYVPVHTPLYRPVQHQPLPSLHPSQNDVKPLVEAVRPKTRGLRLVAQQAAQDNSRAVLAAVGAGMVPATLALMAPLVLGRRRRRRRSLLRSQRSPPPPPLHAPLLRRRAHAM